VDVDIMTVVMIDLESFGSIVAGLMTLSIGICTYLNKLGYIEKWKVKLSIDDDVAEAAKTQSESALIKLNIPDELIDMFKDMAADREGGIDAQRIIDILKDRNELEKILVSEKPLTKDEKSQINCIMLRAMQSYKKSIKNAVTVKE
jgi:hypothetical protein